MKFKDIVRTYNLPDKEEFEMYMNMVHGIYREVVFDEEIEGYVEGYKAWKEGVQQRKEAGTDLVKQAAEERRALEIELSKILISSGFNFDGYTIVKYSGYISGDDAVQIPRSGLFDRGMNGENLTNALVQIRRQALFELKLAAYNLGCNAVIGVDFDYITLEPQTASLTGGTVYEPYVICVTANGNAVIIEKNE